MLWILEGNKYTETVWLTSTGSSHSEGLHPPPWLGRKQSKSQNQNYQQMFHVICQPALLLSAIKPVVPMLKKLGWKNSQVFQCCGKLHTLNSGATCALFRDSSKLKQKSTSASASLSTKFCSSEKERLMMWHTKHRHPHGPGCNLSRTSWCRVALTGRHLLEFNMIKTSLFIRLHRKMTPKYLEN